MVTYYLSDKVITLLSELFRSGLLNKVLNTRLNLKPPQRSPPALPSSPSSTRRVLYDSLVTQPYSQGPLKRPSTPDSERPGGVRLVA